MQTKPSNSWAKGFCGDWLFFVTIILLAIELKDGAQTLTDTSFASV